MDVLGVLTTVAAAAAYGDGSLDPAERSVLHQLFLATGGMDGAWYNSTGWSAPASDPCDGSSWFGIYHWHNYSRIGLGLNVSACTPRVNPLTGWRSLQVLSLTGDIAQYNPSGNGLRGSLAGVDLDRLRALRVLLIVNNPHLHGSIPQLAALTALQAFYLFNNSLTGTVPPVASLTQLRALRLGNNALVGTVPRLDTVTALRVLSLQNNALRGSIPSLHTLTALESLLLYTNRLTGIIPALAQLTVLRQLLLHNNELHGAVPRLPSSVIVGVGWHGPGHARRSNADQRNWAITAAPSLTLFGNRLSCKLPDADTTHVAGSVAVVAFGNRFSAPAPAWVYNTTRDAAFLFVPQDPAWHIILAYLGVGGLLLLSVVIWRAASGGRRRPVAPTYEPRLRCARTVFVALQLDVARVLTALSCLALTTLLPIYMSGANYYTCGDPLMHTSLAYLADAPRATAAAAVFAVVLVWASAGSCRWLYMTYTDNNNAEAAEAADLGAQKARARAHVPPARAPPRAWRCRASQRGIVVALVWLLVTVLFSFPTVLYVVSLYLPADNALSIDAGAALALRRGVPVVLFAVNSIGLPVVARLLVRWMRASSSTDAAHGTLVALLLLPARLLTSIAIPIGAVLTLSDGCGQRWKWLWNACSGNSTFVQYDAALGCSPAGSPGCHYFIPSGAGVSGGGAVLTAQQLCAPDGYTSPLSCTGVTCGPCVRGAIEALAPLFAEKVAIGALLQPALVLLAFEVGALHWVARVLYGRSDATFRIGLDLVLVASLSEIELALFYGVVLPIMLPIAALSAAVRAGLLQFLVRQRGLATLPCATRPIAYLQLSVLLQAGLATWFFGSAQTVIYGTAVGTLTFAGAVGMCPCLGATALNVRPQKPQQQTDDQSSPNGPRDAHSNSGVYLLMDDDNDRHGLELSRSWLGPQSPKASDSQA